MLERQKQALQPVPELSEKQQEIADRKAQFLDLFPRYGTIGDTLRRIGLKSRNSFYEWLKADIQFAAEFEEVKTDYVERLEKEADRRAVDGVNKPVFYKGKLIVDEHGVPITIKEYSDTLLIFRLKALAPDKYRERYENRIDLAPSDQPIQSVSRVTDD